jgi:hypothetical protein
MSTTPQAITKEQFLEQLAEKAAQKVLDGLDDTSRRLLLPAWTRIIREEMKPILQLIK